MNRDIIINIRFILCDVLLLAICEAELFSNLAKLGGNERDGQLAYCAKSVKKSSDLGPDLGRKSSAGAS